MDADREQSFRAFLEEAGLDDKAIQIWMDREKTEGSAFESCVFMKYCWDWVMRADDNNWIRSTIEDLEARQHRTDLLSSLIFPKRPELLPGLQRLEASNAREDDIAMMIREGQLKVLEFVLQMLDGSMSLKKGADRWGMYAVRDIDEEVKQGRMDVATADVLFEVFDGSLVPLKPMPNLQEEVWAFDPATKKPENNK